MHIHQCRRLSSLVFLLLTHSCCCYCCPTTQHNATQHNHPLSQASANAPPVEPLAIAPAPAGSKVMVVCTQGSEEASVAAQWATQSRAGGATVGVCPPDLLDSHAKFNSGTYDSVVVEAGGGLGDAVLGEVTTAMVL